MTNFKGFASFVLDRKSTRLNSSHLVISYAVFCLKKTKYQRLVLQRASTVVAASAHHVTQTPRLHAHVRAVRQSQQEPHFLPRVCSFFFFNDTATTEIYTLSLHDALPI